ncbi:hypothetical protein [Algoriphagus sp. PAP.12]|uniref:hypothetical protein n=1 Tax=Algoriphagus sp. PAP.12 TaxID=2996678 RepID=UPI00227D09E7|nr:hypothetical protein [Algoriphagus sp. PAP.12]
MNFSLQLLLVAALFTVLIILVMAFSNQKILVRTFLILSLLFLAGSAFLLFTEYTAFQKREVRNGAIEIMDWQDLPEYEIIKNELTAFRHFQEFRNALNGYEMFLLDVALQRNDPKSYPITLRDEFIAQLQNQEYEPAYWKKIFAIAFDFEPKVEEFERANYSAVFSIPFGFQDQEEEEDFEDLTNPENYSNFERESQLIYIALKAQSFDRTPEGVSNFWDQNKVYFYTFFSNARYEKLCKELIDDLILVYEEIVHTPLHKKFYTKYDVSDEEFMDFPSKKFTRKFEYSWPFSFWDRRFREQNEKETIRILKEIQNHYKD